MFAESFCRNRPEVEYTKHWMQWTWSRFVTQWYMIRLETEQPQQETLGKNYTMIM